MPVVQKKRVFRKLQMDKIHKVLIQSISQFWGKHDKKKKKNTFTYSLDFTYYNVVWLATRLPFSILFILNPLTLLPDRIILRSYSLSSSNFLIFSFPLFFIQQHLWSCFLILLFQKTKPPGLTNLTMSFFLFIPQISIYSYYPPFTLSQGPQQIFHNLSSQEKWSEHSRHQLVLSKSPVICHEWSNKLISPQKSRQISETCSIAK